MYFKVLMSSLRSVLSAFEMTSSFIFSVAAGSLEKAPEMNISVPFSKKWNEMEQALKY